MTQLMPDPLTPTASALTLAGGATAVPVPMLVKALQELHADFDARLRKLEARA